MKPILFPRGQTDFTTNGLGRLSDAVSCTVTEERNGQYELHMEYPIDGRLMDVISYSQIIYAVPADNKSPQPFSIYRISKPLSGIVEIDAEHVSYQMTHIPIMPFTASSLSNALDGLSTYAAENNPFTFETNGSFDTVGDNTFKLEEPDNLRSLLFGQEGSFIDTYGGEWEFDKYSVVLHKYRGSDNGVTIRYGKNLISLEQEENIQNTYTGICPFWKGQDLSGNDTVVYLPEKVLHSESAANYPYQRTKIVDMSSYFQEAPTVEELRTKGEAYIRNNDVGTPAVSLDVSFVALNQVQEYADLTKTEHINLCDTVTVIFPALNVSTKAKVVKTVWNVLLDRYDSISIGAVQGKLSRTLQNAERFETITRKTVQELTTIVENGGSMDEVLAEAKRNASELIKNALNGHIVITDDASELLIMDTDDIETATKVWRWNLGGLGYSDTGYEGTYGLAMTMDGAIVADRITTGTLNAGVIKAGIIADLLNNNWWNLETGVLHLSAGGVGSTEIAGGAITTEKIQANAVTTDKIQAGSITADKLAAGIISTQILYADKGDIAELTVDQIDTSRRIVRYLTHDTSDDRYFRGSGMQLDFVISSVVFSGGTAQTARLCNRYGQYLYWEKEVTPRAIANGDVIIVNGYPYIPAEEEGEQDERVYVTTRFTEWPVTVYEYEDKVVRSLTFERDPDTGYFQPVDIYGMGTVLGSDYGKTKVMKRTDGFEIVYTTRNGKEAGAYWADDGFVDLNHRRADVRVNTGSQTITIQPEGQAQPIRINYTESGNALNLTWEDGKSFTVEVT